MDQLLAQLQTALAGKKTYVAAAGLLGLAVYEFSQGDYANAGKSAMAALAAFGLRSAIATTHAAVTGQADTPPAAPPS